MQPPFQKQHGYGSIPINTIFRGLWTSINPSYFDVHQNYIKFWPIPTWETNQPWYFVRLWFTSPVFIPTAQPHFHQPLGGHCSASQQRCSGKSDASWPLKQSSRGAASQSAAAFSSAKSKKSRKTPWKNHENHENTMEKPKVWWLYQFEKIGRTLDSFTLKFHRTLDYSRLAAPLHMLTDKI